MLTTDELRRVLGPVGIWMPPPAGTGLDPAATDEYVAVLTAPGAMTAALNWYRAMDAIEPLGPVAVPTLYVWSSDDPALGRAAAEATARPSSGSEPP